MGYALARLTAGEVAILGNLELLFGVAFAALLARDMPTVAQLGGGALILVGAWFATRAGSELVTAGKQDDCSSTAALVTIPKAGQLSIEATTRFNAESRAFEQSKWARVSTGMRLQGGVLC